MSRKNIFILFLALLISFSGIVFAQTRDNCDELYNNYANLIELYDSNQDNQLSLSEVYRAVSAWMEYAFDNDSLLGILSFSRSKCSVPSQENDPVFGRFSASSTTVAVGEPITLVVEARDNDGLDYVWAYYQSRWHRDYADGTEFTGRFTFSESKAGVYTYRGYVYGRKPDGSREGAWTEPRTVTVTVEESLDCQELYWFDNQHLTCGYKQFCGDYVYQGLQTFETEAACAAALASQATDCSDYGSQYWCADYDEWALECRGQGNIIPLGDKFCYSGSNRYDYCGTCQETIENHPLAGTLSVSKSSVSAGESFNLTISAQDGDGVKMLKAFLGDKWHTNYCDDQTSCSKIYTLEESEPGDYYYYGYIFGYLPDGDLEYDWTTPKYVKVAVGRAASRGPDLIISSIVLEPVSPDTNDEISFAITIKNIGDEKMPDVDGGIITKVSSDSLAYSGWRICDAMTEELDPGESDTIDCPIFQVLSEGSHSFTFLVDSSARLSETNESNNEKVKTFSVSSAGGGDGGGDETACTDSDGGANFYQYGEADSNVSGVEGRIDCCKMYYSTDMGDSVEHIGPGGGACVDSGPYLYEAICENDIPYMMVYQCPDGCQNGVCVRE